MNEQTVTAITKYRAALEKLCVRGRCPIAEEALGI